MIRVLDKFIADKIAAGEVIERPVSAVKELVENSIDAGAHSIIVEIRGGGRSYIRVTDDGAGIPAEEAETAFLRHATSKISGISDLDNITSLGFRGEALASIAAVSKLTMVTRTPDRPAGVRIMLHGGRVISKETTGANPGTTIVVEDLFYNTPARRKFMGSEAREASAIIDLIEQYAVCYSDIRFMMIRNGETVFTTAGDGDTLAAIQKIYPDTDHARLIPVDGSRVHGFISDPGTTKNTRKGQLFFVNGRLVSSPVIEKGLEKGYRGRIFSGFPVAILFIEADPHDIDVNIHPGKKEIRFLHQDEIVGLISDAVEDSMRSTEAVPAGIAKPASAPVSAGSAASGASVQDILTSDAEYISERTLYPDRITDQPMTTGEQSSIRDYLGSIVRKDPADSRDKEPAAAAPADVPVPDIREAADRPFSFDDLRFAGYVLNTYIIMESSDSIYMIDQHAAHERIYYEKFRSAYLSSDQLPQPVLTPVTLSVSADVYYTGKEMLEPLHRMGYDISDFGTGTFIVRGVPPYISLSEAVDWLRAYFESIDDSTGVNDTVIDKLIMKSCKSAVKGGEKLSRMEIDDLIKELAGCRDPYACPHGRPTFVRFTRYDIERSFRRK